MSEKFSRRGLLGFFAALPAVARLPIPVKTIAPTLVTPPAPSIAPAQMCLTSISCAPLCLMTVSVSHWSPPTVIDQTRFK